MKDSFKREIDYLRISVTDRCNLKCLYCMPDGIVDKKEHDEIMRDEEIINVVTESAKIGITKIRITGGEPLLRRGIYELISKIRNVKGIKEITITTNAILLVGKVKKLKEAGVSRVNFSLDTLDDEKFKFISNTNLTLDYISLIEELIENEMQPIKINAVLLKGFNVSEIPGFIQLANKYDISIRLIELMTIGHLKFDYDKYYISKGDVLKMYPELKFVKKDSVSEYYKVEGNKGLIGFINPISHKFCSDCNRIRLTADGNLKPCLLSNNEIFIKEIKGDLLLEKLKNAIISKPISHTFDESKNEITNRPMNKIGG